MRAGQEINLQILLEGAFHPDQTEWEALIDVPPEKHGTLPYCENHWKVNVATKLDISFNLRINKVLLLLGKVLGFSILDVNRG